MSKQDLFQQIRRNHHHIIMAWLKFPIANVIFSEFAGVFIYIFIDSLLMSNHITNHFYNNNQIIIILMIIIAIIMTITTLIYTRHIIKNAIPIMMKLNNAHLTKYDEALQAKNILQALSIGANIYEPKLYIIKDSAPNALAVSTSIKHSAIAITSGLLKNMNKYQLEGVLAQTISRIRNHSAILATIGIAPVAIYNSMEKHLMKWLNDDTTTTNNNQKTDDSLAIVLAMGIVYIGYGLSYIFEMHMSQDIDLTADLDSIDLTRNPKELVSALKYLKKYGKSMKDISLISNPLYIISPIKAKSIWSLAYIFDMHADIDERIHNMLDKI